MYDSKCTKTLPTKCVAGEWLVWAQKEWLKDRNLTMRCGKLFLPFKMALYLSFNC